MMDADDQILVAGAFSIATFIMWFFQASMSGVVSSSIAPLTGVLFIGEVIYAASLITGDSAADVSISRAAGFVAWVRSTVMTGTVVSVLVVIGLVFLGLLTLNVAAQFAWLPVALGAAVWVNREMVRERVGV